MFSENLPEENTCKDSFSEKELFCGPPQKESNTCSVDLLRQNVSLDHNYTLSPEKKPVQIAINSVSTTPIKITAKNKKSRKHYKQFSQAEMCYKHQSKKNIEKVHVIKNATKLNPRVLKKKIYHLKNTSAFDAVLESLIFCYKNLKTCRKLCDDIYVEQKGFDIFNLVKNFTSRPNYQAIYKERFQFLLNVASINENREIQYNDSIGTLLDKMMNKNYFYTEILTCNQCNKQAFRNEVAILLKRSTEFNLKNLNHNVNNYFKDRTCDICLHPSIHVDPQFIGPFLILNIDELRVQDFPKSMPANLNVCSKKFDLIATVGWNLIDNEKHYVAYCRTLNNIWYEHNDLHDYSRKAKKSPVLNVSLLIYV